MQDKTHIPAFLLACKESVEANHFVSLTLGHPVAEGEVPKNIYVKKVRIKNADKLSFTYRYARRDIVKNYTLEEGLEQLSSALGNTFRTATLFTTTFDLVLDMAREQKPLLKKIAPTKTTVPSTTHDQQKKHAIAPAGKKYLTALQLTDEKGQVYKSAQDKFRQINHYIEILNPLIRALPKKPLLKIADMGSGKGYLTFALYDHLANNLNQETDITGVEYRQDLVNLCNGIAVQTGFNGLHFAEGSIEGYDAAGTDVLIALHACDTATDDAIAKGIDAGASLIVVAPCCHKQIRKEMERSKVKNEVSFITRHGIFLERQAEMATDAIRAMVLEYFGYKVKVFEFITDAHTPKNIMITAIRSARSNEPDAALLEKIHAAMQFFGVREHYLVKKIGL